MFLRISGEYNTIVKNIRKLYNLEQKLLYGCCRSLSIAVAVLMFYTGEMEEEPPLLLLLGVEKEEKSIESF